MSDGQVYLLDSEGLSQWVRGDRIMGARIKDAGLHGHKYAIDAALAAVVLRQPGLVTIFPSDEDDMRKSAATVWCS